MYNKFYLGQAQHLKDWDPVVTSLLADANENAITLYNSRIKDGLLPERKNKQGEIIPYTRASKGPGQRVVSSEVANIAAMLPGHDMGGYKRKMPGVISYNHDTQTFNVLVTEHDFVTQRTTPMKVGKYFRKLNFYTEGEVNTLANQFKSLMYASKHSVLQWATTADECVAVYIDGPNSCMSGDNFYAGHRHPASVYGTDDVHVAYAKIEDRIVARTVCNVRDKEYSGIYGNRDLLAPLLEKEGYTEGSISGCRLWAIEYDGDGDVYIMPYLDDASSCKRAGEYLIVGSGDISCSETSGLSQTLSECAYCNDYVDLDEGIYVEGNDSYYCCDCCVEADGYVVVENGDWGDTYVHEGDVVYCESDGRYHYSGDHDLVMVGDDCYLEHDDDIIWSDDQDEWILLHDSVHIEHIDSWVDADRAEEFDEQGGLLDE